MNVVSAHKVLAAIIGALVLVALCAGTAFAVTGHNAVSQPQHAKLMPARPAPNYKTQYLADVALSNALAGTISGHDGWRSRPVTAYSNALVVESRTMLRQTWPVSVRGDVHALTLASLKVHDDILARDGSGFETDATAASVEGNVIRVELGLATVQAPNIRPPHHHHASPPPQAAPTPAAPAPAPAAPAPAPAAPGFSYRGIGTNGEAVYANAITSTPFAMNVESDYWNTPGMQFTSYSPVTGQDYSMSAVVGAGEVTVTNGLGCVIEFANS